MEDVQGTFFPYELEQLIFTEAAHSFPSSAKNFMLVAHRVHQWMGHIIYRICNQLVVPYIPNTDKPGAPSVHYFGQFVKHLIIGGDAEPDRIKLFLEACPNLIDLALWTAHPTKDLLPLFANLKLQRLSTNLSSLDERDIKGPYLSYITHLDITFFGEEFEQWKAMEHLPALTHLAINDAVDSRTVQYLLYKCPKIQILLAINDSEVRENLKLVDAQIHDPRFVMMDIKRLTVKDWENGTNGEEDIWTCAEHISAAKRCGSFPTADFCTWFSRYKWREELDALES